MQKPLTIKQLKKYDEKPVWVEYYEYPELKGWYIVKYDKTISRYCFWGIDERLLDGIDYDKDFVAFAKEII